VPATALFRSLPVGIRTTVKVPLSCFAAAGTDLEVVNPPFPLYRDAAFALSVAHVRWRPQAAGGPDAVGCPDLT
jgi:beta-glucosidase